MLVKATIEVVYNVTPSWFKDNATVADIIAAEAKSLSINTGLIEDILSDNTYKVKLVEAKE